MGHFLAFNVVVGCVYRILKNGGDVRLANYVVENVHLVLINFEIRSVISWLITPTGFSALIMR